MNASQTVFAYHDRTKHRPQRYAASLGYMDWATQPHPFRRYSGAAYVELPLALDHATPPYHLLFQDNDLPVAPLHVKSLSQLLQFALGIAVYKRAGDSRWALRMNASSGNLHPTEAYVMLPPLEGVSTQASLSHYACDTHGLETLAALPHEPFDALEPGSFFMALSSIHWREAWKYGERSWRYCQLDAGHALRALQVSCAMLGWHCHYVDALKHEQLQGLLGLDQLQRFSEHEFEHADMLLLISPKAQPAIPSLASWQPQSTYQSIANRLSATHHIWEVLEEVENATAQTPALHVSFAPRTPEPSKESKTVVMKRRSAQAMDRYNAHISEAAFKTLLRSVTCKDSRIALAIFVHDVETLERGLYCFVPDAPMKQKLHHAMHENFEWRETLEGLYLLKAGDYRAIAKNISCSQDIAADGAFSLGMIAEFEATLTNTPQQYKALYWECGMIGQQLYLEATALGLSATGIGCFLDDIMHRLLGFEDTQFQSLYHFTIGRAIIDMRLQNDPPYSR